MQERDELVKEHTDLLFNIESMELIPKDDPDLLRMEEIMEELKNLKELED